MLKRTKIVGLAATVLAIAAALLVLSGLGTRQAEAVFSDYDGDAYNDYLEILTGSDPGNLASTPESLTVATFQPSPGLCGDGLDNDGDGSTDGADSGCLDGDGDGYDSVIESYAGSSDFFIGGAARTPESIYYAHAKSIYPWLPGGTGCFDNVDNDLDGSFDTADPGCLAGDFDGDGLYDYDEKVTYGTSLLYSDSDGDTLGDGDEVMLYGTNPADSDSDDDGLTDGSEIDIYGTDPLDPDSDNDTCTDGYEVFTSMTSPLFPDCPPGGADTDGDGCPDAKEQQTAPGSQMTGGLRNYLNPSDYFKPTHDGLNRIDDVLKVISQCFDDDNDANLGLPPYAAGYDPGTDRTDDPGSGEAWDLLGGNGQQRLDDVLAIIKQYFHDCS